MEYCLHCNVEMRGPQAFPGFCCKEHRSAYFRASMRPSTPKVAYRVQPFARLEAAAVFEATPGPARWNVGGPRNPAKSFWPTPPRTGSRIPVASMGQRWASAGIRKPQLAQPVLPSPQPRVRRRTVLPVQLPGWHTTTQLPGSTFSGFHLAEADSATTPIRAAAPLRWRQRPLRRTYDPAPLTLPALREIVDGWAVDVLAVSVGHPPPPQLREDRGPGRLFARLPEAAIELPDAIAVGRLGLVEAPAWSPAVLFAKPQGVLAPHAVEATFLAAALPRIAPTLPGVGRATYRLPAPAALPLPPALWEAAVTAGDVTLNLAFPTPARPLPVPVSLVTTLVTTLATTGFGPGAPAALKVLPEANPSMAAVPLVRHATAALFPVVRVQTGRTTVAIGGFKAYAADPAVPLSTGFGTTQFRHAMALPGVLWPAEATAVPLGRALEITLRTQAPPLERALVGDLIPEDLTPPVQIAFLRRRAHPPSPGFATVPHPAIRQPHGEPQFVGIHPLLYKGSAANRRSLSMEMVAYRGKPALVAEASPLSHRWNRKQKIWERLRWVEQHSIVFTQFPFEDTPPFGLFKY